MSLVLQLCDQRSLKKVCFQRSCELHFPQLLVEVGFIRSLSRVLRGGFFQAPCLDYFEASVEVSFSYLFRFVQRPIYVAFIDYCRGCFQIPLIEVASRDLYWGSSQPLSRFPADLYSGCCQV